MLIGLGGCLALPGDLDDGEVSVGEATQTLVSDWVLTQYFSDDTYSTIVGQIYTNCNGVTRSWGSTSDFVIQDSGACF